LTYYVQTKFQQASARDINAVICFNKNNKVFVDNGRNIWYTVNKGRL